MKFTSVVDIEQPIDKVAAFFADPQNLKYYQEGFQSKELISGIPGEEGAVSKMYYEWGKRKLELEETVISNQLPHEFFAKYHHEHMDNTMKSCFVKLSDASTRYQAEIEYTAFRGFMPKVIAKLFPGVYKRQVQKWLNNFKEYVESSSEEMQANELSSAGELE